MRLSFFGAKTQDQTLWWMLIGIAAYCRPSAQAVQWKGQRLERSFGIVGDWGKQDGVKA